MNYELIIKLAKLANNNPNENEANLAARKVCKLLAEANYQFVAEVKIPKKYTPRQPPFSSDDLFKDLYDRMKRAQEPSYNPFTDWFGQKQYAKDDNHYYRYSYDYETPSKIKEERDLKCKTCGKVVKTKFVGLPEIFECNTCQWTAYERIKNDTE